MRFWLFIFVLFAFPVIALAQTESYMLKLYDTAKVNTKVLNKEYSIEIGDSNQSGFDPSFEISAWRGECKMRVNLSTVSNPMELASKIVSFANGKSRVTLSTAKVSHDMFAKSETEFEWHIILNQKPDTNVFTYDIETEGFNFHYQYDAADTSEVADSAQGSYLVTHATRRNNYRYLGKNDTTYENYMTSVAFIAWRPNVWDAVGKDTVWCSLNVDTEKSKLSITVPQKFLDDAAYPATIGPTFGKSTTGVFSGNLANGKGYAHKGVDQLNHTAGSGETIDSVFFYGQEQTPDGGATIKIAVYKVSVADTLIAGDQLYKSGTYGLPNTFAWVGGSTGGVSMTNGDTYVMAYGQAINGAKHEYSNLIGQGSCADTGPPGGLDNPWNNDACTGTWVGSCYAVYSVTEAAAGQVIMIQQ